MKSHLMRGLVAALLAIPLLLIASCSKKDKGTTPDNSGAPTLAFPQFSQAVTFVGSDAAMQGAKDKVQSEIALVAPWIATPRAIATALNAGQWGAKAEGCWSKSSSQSNCTTTMKLCDASAGSYDFTRTLNGNCSGVDHANWVDAAGTRTANGGTGTIRTYRNNSTDVDSLWTWSTSADNNTKNWKIYAGAEAPANLAAQLQWTKGAGNSSNWSFQQLGSFTLSAGASTATPAKWTLTASSDAKTGTMDIYSWSAGSSAGAASFWLSDRIAWSPDSSGAWTQYTVQGDSTITSWPATVPNVVIPEIGHDVVFNTTMECASLAYSTVQSQIVAVHALSMLGGSFLHIFDSLPLGNQVGGCWTWNESFLSCNETWDLCPISGGYHWSFKEDGNCPGGTFSNWVEAEGSFSEDGRSATVIIYELGSATVASTTVWTTAADGKSGTLTMYTGAVSEETKSTQYDWSVAGDGSTDITTEYFGSSRSKAVTHESADGTSGYYRSYEWDETPPGTFWMNMEIQWNSDGSGVETMYERDGTSMIICQWP